MPGLAVSRRHAAPVDRARPAQVPVETRHQGDEVGQRELLQAGNPRSAVILASAIGSVRSPGTTNRRPSPVPGSCWPSRRRPRGRGQALQRADRRPVVAGTRRRPSLLDDDRATLGGPAGSPRPVLGGRHRSGSPLVEGAGRGHGIGATVSQQVDQDASPSARCRHLQPGHRAASRASSRTTSPPARAGFAPAAASTPISDEAPPRAQPVQIGHLIPLGHGAAHPVPSPGSAAQAAEPLRRSGRRTRRSGLRRSAPAYGPQPRAPGEARHVGAAVAQVDRRLGPREPPARRGRGSGERRQAATRV